jgi:H+/Cl- antiporter ClcA
MQRSPDSTRPTPATGGLPVSPTLEATVEALHLPGIKAPESQHRIFVLAAAAVLVAVVATAAAEVLINLIALITNLAFHGRWSFAETAPFEAALGPWVIGIPVIGGLVVGVMARFGSPAIRGHGIPEAMEQVLYNQSRIAPRVTILKPLSAAIAIGTGGPFGAEGPIIATGGALGSLLGQLTETTAEERKILLAAGAAAGMTAIFGTPVSAVLLAIELLLFEYRARSLVPVALAASAAAALRLVLHGSAPVFPMTDVAAPGGWAIAAYVLLGAVIGLVAVGITRTLYAVEDAFERLPVHWMWWPALGALAVGVVGYFAPRTLGVGYQNIEDILQGHLAGTVLLTLVTLKFVSWAIALGSGTSGGTLAPLMTIGGGLGALVGARLLALAPASGVDVRIAGLVGMAAIFAGASHALLTSVVFAFEATRQPLGLLPLLAGCTGAYLVSLRFMRTSIMTERLARRGARVSAELAVDHLARVLVRDGAARDVVSLGESERLGHVRAWLAAGAGGAQHQGFPVLDGKGLLIGVVTRRDLLDPLVGDAAAVRTIVKRAPVVIHEDDTMRDAADQMVRERVGRLPVVRRENPREVVGMLSRSDLLEAHAPRLEAEARAERSIGLAARRGRRKGRKK